MSREGRFCLTHIAELEAMSRWGNPDVPTFKNDWHMSQSEPSPITHFENESVRTVPDYSPCGL